MKYMVKGIVWIVLITIGLLLGPPLLIGFVWWKVLIFGIACYLIGHIIDVEKLEIVIKNTEKQTFII